MMISELRMPGALWISGTVRDVVTRLRSFPKEMSLSELIHSYDRPASCNNAQIDSAKDKFH
jgi:hypothetical protein